MVVKTLISLIRHLVDNINSYFILPIEIIIHFTYSEVGTAHYEADEAAKAKKMEDVKKETIPFYLDKLDAIAKENNGFLALGRVCSPFY